MLISRISIVLSIIGIYIGISIQYHLYADFQAATGKTQALYGLKHLMNLDYVFIGIISLLLSIISVFKKENSNTIILTLILSILSILLIIFDIWRLFV